jgi:ankyrin repeat protein
VEDARGNTALLWACEQGRDEVAAALLAAEATRHDHANEDGETALMLASRGGHLAIAKRLLERGAAPNEKNVRRGRAPPEPSRARPPPFPSRRAAARNLGAASS